MTRRRGRPPLEDAGRGTDGRSPDARVVLPASDLAAVQRIAAEQEVSVASVIRRALTQYLRARAVVAPPSPSPALPPSPSGPRLARSVVRRGSF